MLSLLRDHAERAAAVLPAQVRAYVETGSGAEVSVGEAERAWGDWRLRPRVLRDVTSVSSATTLLGEQLRTPVLVAPTAFHRMLHPDGELASAAGARDAGSLLVLSSRSTTRLEDVAAVGCPWWWQVYLMRERSVTEAMVRRAVASGASALVLTGDTPYVGTKARGGRPLPLDDELSLVNAAPHLPEGVDPRMATEEHPGVTFEDIGWLAAVSGLPVLVKGVLRGDDALTCLDAGASGVIVSNHGGRQLDRAQTTARALPGVVEAVAGRAPVLVDGGIRSGLDVLVALALGASAVLLGRPVMWALASAGAEGVRAVIDALDRDLSHAMALAGARALVDLDRSLVVDG